MEEHNYMPPHIFNTTRLCDSWHPVVFNNLSVYTFYDIRVWLDKSCSNKYTINLSGIFFESQEDLFAYTLRWGDKTGGTYEKT